MLVHFRGKLKYRVYMQIKPAKYGIKICILADVRADYFSNGFVYAAPWSLTQEIYWSKHKQYCHVFSLLLAQREMLIGDNYSSSIQLGDELNWKQIASHMLKHWEQIKLKYHQLFCLIEKEKFFSS